MGRGARRTDGMGRLSRHSLQNETTATLLEESPMGDLRLESISLAALKPYERNALRLNSPLSAKKLTLSRLTHETFKHTLDFEVKSELDELRRKRNIASHLGEFSDAGSGKAHEILEIEIDQIITREVADRSIELAWRIPAIELRAAQREE
jgi:hypothetical protein